MGKEVRDIRTDFMTDEEVLMVDRWLTKIDQNRGYMGEYYTEWKDIHTLYKNAQEEKEDSPNSRINILLANIEGQVAALVEQNMSVTCRGQGPSDQSFAEWARIGLEWALKENKIKTKLDRHERRRELFGVGWIKVYYDPKAIDGYGLPTITCPSPNNVFVDMKINDSLNLEEAEYIAEVMPKSKIWAQEEYGEVANNIYYGGSDKSTIFTKDRTTDDEDLFYLVQLWTKTKGVLRMLEFSDDGVLLYDSFKDKEIGKKAYYRRNKYPYFLTLMYPEEGKLIGFGDGKLLKPLQNMINDLYDQIRRAARPNRIFFDPDSNVDLEEMDEDDGPVPCEKPSQNIFVVEPGRVNPALWQLLNNIHNEVQRVTRFSELMMGQGMATKTATEASIQQQQGSSATDHKKLMLQDTLVEVCEYILDMLMENVTEGRMFRVTEDKDEFEWIDFRQLNNIPQLMPASEAYQKEYQDKNGVPADKWMQLSDNGKGVTKSVDLDIDISIGAGLPKNKAFLWQMGERLSSMVVENRNVVTHAEIRKFVKDFLGLPLEDEAEQMAQMPPQVPPMQNMNANVEGLTTGGNPAMANLPPQMGGAPQ